MEAHQDTPLEEDGEIAPHLGARIETKENPCQGSPLKKIPWFTNVVVTNRANHASVTVKLIDLGPSAPPAAHAAIDLTQEAFTTLGGDLKAGRLLVDFRIINGAKLLNLV